MALHMFFVAAVGTGGVLLALTGLRLIRAPRRLWKSWYAFEHRWRMARFGGGWTHVESATRRRGYFWVPRDIELAAPDDVYRYALSDRFWRSGYSWFVRALIWYSGLLFIFFGLLVLGAGLSGFP